MATYREKKKSLSLVCRPLPLSQTMMANQDYNLIEIQSSGSPSLLSDSAVDMLIFLNECLWENRLWHEFLSIKSWLVRRERNSNYKDLYDKLDAQHRARGLYRRVEEGTQDFENFCCASDMNGTLLAIKKKESKAPEDIAAELWKAKSRVPH